MAATQLTGKNVRDFSLTFDDIAGLQGALDTKAMVASPNFTGTAIFGATNNSTVRIIPGVFPTIEFWDSVQLKIRVQGVPTGNPSGLIFYVPGDFSLRSDIADTGSTWAIFDAVLSNFHINASGKSSGGGSGVLVIGDTVTPPTNTHSGRSIIYSQAGVPRARAANGTTRQLAPMQVDMATEAINALKVANGGTNASDAPTARQNLGVTEGSVGNLGLSSSTDIPSRITTIFPTIYTNLQTTNIVVWPYPLKPVQSGVFTTTLARFSLVYIPFSYNLRRLGFYCTTVGAAGAVAEVALFDLSGGLVMSSGEVACTSLGLKRGVLRTLNTIPPGAYYVAARTNSTLVQLAVNDSDLTLLGTPGNVGQNFTSPQSTVFSTTVGTPLATPYSPDTANDSFIFRMESG